MSPADHERHAEFGIQHGGYHFRPAHRPKCHRCNTPVPEPVLWGAGHEKHVYHGACAELERRETR